MKDPTIVRTFPDRGEAEIARALLEAEGIAAAVPAEERGGITSSEEFLAGVQLVVESTDVERALAVLDEAVSPEELDAAELDSENPGT